MPPAAGAALVQVVPLLVKTLPAVPDAVIPVPPFAAAKVPARVTVPALVTGPPLVVRPVVPPDTSTLVTDPEPGPVNAI